MSITVYATVVHLSCPKCGVPFSVNRKWWSRRLLSKAPALRCKDCAPHEHP